MRHDHNFVADDDAIARAIESVRHEIAEFQRVAALIARRKPRPGAELDEAKRYVAELEAALTAAGVRVGLTFSQFLRFAEVDARQRGMRIEGFRVAVPPLEDVDAERERLQAAIAETEAGQAECEKRIEGMRRSQLGLLRELGGWKRRVREATAALVNHGLAS